MTASLSGNADNQSGPQETGGIDTVLPSERGETVLISPSLLLYLATLFLLATIGWYGYQSVEKEMKKNLSAQLATTLSANVESLKIWTEDKKTDAEILAAQPEIREKILSLVALTQEKDISAAFLKQTPELGWLREHLGSACKKYGFIGFVLFDPTGYQVGALLEEPVGKRQIIGKSDFFYRSLQGDTVLSHPFPGEVPLPDMKGVWRKNWPTMFASTPIRDRENRVVGVLAFRIRPETNFTQILEVSRFGNTGETYAFNKEGLMLSDSRFTDELKSLGLIPAEPWGNAILNVQLRVPATSLLRKSGAGSQTSEPAPLTRMAASAVQGTSWQDLDGYFDYRGKNVIGAWTWLPEHHFGVATEIDVEEAFGPLYSLMRGFFLMFGLLVLASLAAGGLRWRQIRVEQERNRAWDQLKVSETWRRSMLDNVMHAIVTIDPNGIIQSFNTAAEKQFGYREEEVLGANVNVLMPEPYRSKHDGYLERYRVTGEARILGSVVEVPGQHRDGSVFDLELAVNKISAGTGYFFTGIMREITERKKADARLQSQARQQAGVAELGKSALAGADPQDLMFQAVRLLRQTLDVDFAQVLEHHVDTDTFTIRAGTGWGDGVVGKTNIPGGDRSHAGYTFLCGVPVVVEDFTKETRFSCPPIIHEHGVKSGVSVLIQAGSVPFGAMGIHTKQQRTFAEDEIHFLEAVAHILATAIERKQSEERLQHYAQELERSNSDLEDFASIASHDLQEPLRKALLFGDRIKMTSSESAGESVLYVERLQRSMHKMKDFINDLLLFSRTTRPGKPFERIDLNEMLKAVVFNLEEMVNREEGTVRLHTLPAVEGNRFQLTQLFQNLIANGLKYHRKGEPPQVEVRCRHESRDDCEIVVEDRGIGIDPKYHEKIFKPFERLHTDRDYSGNGIGLAICAKVINQHRGTIRIETPAAGGSAFVMCIPKQQHKTSSPIPQAAKTRN